MSREATVRSSREAAGRLLREVIAPLALGGAITPGAAMGPDEVRSIRDERPADLDAARTARVDEARLRRARALTPVDRILPIGPADWALAAAFQDILQAAHPGFAHLLRRRSAAAMLDLAHAILDRVSAPATLGEALARHSWLARVLDVRRTDTRVSWWSGSRSFLGRPPPPRVAAWPGIRRVTIERVHRSLFELSPLAVPRSAFAMTTARLLVLSPLTDLSTCGRDGEAPAFAWSAPVLALIAARAGRSLAARVLAAGDANAVDAALGRATRELVAVRPVAAHPVLQLLAQRALARALDDEHDGSAGAAETGAISGRDAGVTGLTSTASGDARLARALGALTAARALGWTAPGPIAAPARGDEDATSVGAVAPDAGWSVPSTAATRTQVAQALAAAAVESPEAQRLLRFP